MLGSNARANGKTTRLYVSSAGGHFTELREFASADAGVDRAWVLPRTPQTESSIGTDKVTWLRPISSRGYLGVLRGLPAAWRLHRRIRPVEVVSTGAAQAIPHLLVAAVHRTPIRYIESATRFAGPSVTGRMASRLPTARLVSQTVAWTPDWTVVPDLFSNYQAIEAPVKPGSRKVVLSLGTERFPFHRAVDQVRAVVPANELQIQRGSTPSELVRPGEQVAQWLPSQELDLAVRDASCVVVHGGVGSILGALRLGKVPVVLARDPRRGEHVDDHQLRLCGSLSDRGLVVLVEPGHELNTGHLARAEALAAQSTLGGTDPQANRSILVKTQSDRRIVGVK